MKFKRKQQLPLLIAAPVFLLGGIDALQHQDLLVGVADLIAGILNLAAVLLIRSSPRVTTVLLNVLNAAVAGVMALASVQAGKSYIQYAWALALLFFIGAAVLAIRSPRPGRVLSPD